MKTLRYAWSTMPGLLMINGLVLMLGGNMTAGACFFIAAAVWRLGDRTFDSVVLLARTMGVEVVVEDEEA